MEFLNLAAVREPERLVELRHRVRAFLADEISSGRITPHSDQWLAG